MKRKQFSEEQIIKILSEGEAGDTELVRTRSIGGSPSTAG